MRDELIKTMYDDFKNKDMSFAEFRNRYKRATDPKRFQRDLGRVVRGRAMKRRINAALGGRSR